MPSFQSSLFISVNLVLSSFSHHDCQIYVALWSVVDKTPKPRSLIQILLKKRETWITGSHDCLWKWSKTGSLHPNQITICFGLFFYFCMCGFPFLVDYCSSLLLFLLLLFFFFFFFFGFTSFFYCCSCLFPLITFPVAFPIGWGPHPTHSLSGSSALLVPRENSLVPNSPSPRSSEKRSQWLSIPKVFLYWFYIRMKSKDA